MDNRIIGRQEYAGLRNMYNRNIGAQENLESNMDNRNIETQEYSELRNVDNRNIKRREYSGLRYMDNEYRITGMFRIKEYG